MTEKKYLIYLDILGFYKLAKDIADEKGKDQRDVRKKFIDTINERIDKLEKEGRVIGEPYTDNWILVTDSFDNVFYCISEILDHNTGYKGYEQIPIEFAIGTGEYDKWARFKGNALVREDSTIEFLKLSEIIIEYYHEWYKGKKGYSPISTYIIFTASAHDELELIDKRMCQKIDYKQKVDAEDGDIVFYLADFEKFQLRGKVVKFLEEIKLPGHRFYKRIEELYVPPLEYDDIVKTLKEKKIVFITGTQEYGKTFTAVRLMWEYYKNGYHPTWIKGGELSERIEVRKRLENIRAELKPKHIIYYEDPFGKIRYERRETLEREIGTIIDSIRQVEDVYVIITSRDEVFKEFEKEKISAKELRDFERRLNIKRPSYDYERRKQILLNWAEESNCKWLKNEKLKEFVLEKMEDERILPTPLSMRDFAVATKDMDREDELKEKLKEKSKETAKAFAKEIKNMTDDKVLFLSFLFIGRFSVEFVREMYQELVKELNLKDAWEFDRVLDWFKSDKVDIIGGAMEFGHPSYTDALEYILVENGYFTRINKEIFGKVLLKLSERDEAASDVAWIVAKNFNKLPEDVISLIFKLSERDKTAKSVVWAVTLYWEKLPEDVKNILFELSERDETAEHIALLLAGHFNRLPEGVRNQLLLKLSGKDKPFVALYVADAIVKNFDALPEDVRNLLFKLSEKDEAALAVAHVVAEYWYELSPCVTNVIMCLLESEKMQKAFQKVIFEKRERDPRFVLDLISNIWPKLDKDFVLWELNGLRNSEDEEIRKRAFDLMQCISER